MSKKKFEELTIDELWQLREEIVLYSVLTSNYNNSFGFNPNDVSQFFDGYADYLCELQDEGDPSIPPLEYDSKENLWSWFNCYDDLSWVRHCEEEVEENIDCCSIGFWFNK